MTWYDIVSIWFTWTFCLWNCLVKSWGPLIFRGVWHAARWKQSDSTGAKGVEMGGSRFHHSARWGPNVHVFGFIYTQMLHVWNIYLHWVIIGVNVGKYSIRGASGICIYIYYWLSCVYLYIYIYVKDTKILNWYHLYTYLSWSHEYSKYRSHEP